MSNGVSDPLPPSSPTPPPPTVPAAPAAAARPAPSIQQQEVDQDKLWNLWFTRKEFFNLAPGGRSLSASGARPSRRCASSSRA